MNKSSNAFTVVEVAIAIALVAIGSTIGACAVSGYTRWAADVASAASAADMSSRDAAAGYDLLKAARARRDESLATLRRDDITSAERDDAIRTLSAAQVIIDAASGVR